MTDYGLDIADLDPTFLPVSGPRAVALAVARRYLTPRGFLSYDADFGFDVRELLGAPLDPSRTAALERALAAEAEKDERVEGADVDLTATGETLSLQVALRLKDGPFQFVLTVDRLRAVFAEA